MQRHRVDVFAFGAGLLFLLLAAGFLLDALDVWDADVAWLPPALLIVFGLAGVLATVTRRPERTEPGEGVE
jgi:hypothetical protein